MTLANIFDGEIVNCDSRQVYRGMDIGTAKPSHQERALVPHHLMDIIDPDESYSLAIYLAQARQAIRGIQNRGKIPFLVGGTGQYALGLLEGFHAPQVPPNPSLRKQLQEHATEHGTLALWQELSEIDAESASKIDHRNVRRVIRALEVYVETGVPVSKAKRKEMPPYYSLIIGLTLERSILYKRIDLRIHAMLDDGWPEEVTRLIENGYTTNMESMSSLGYRELAAYLKGEMSLEMAMGEIKAATRRFVRHQYTWFRLKDPRIRWLDASLQDLTTKAVELLSHHISHSRWTMVKSIWI